MSRSTRGSMSSMEDIEGIIVTAIAIDKDKNSQFAVKWAVDNIFKKNHELILIHVRTQALEPQDSNATPKGGRAPTEAEMHQFFLPYRGFCARKGIKAKEVVIHDIDISSALVNFINSNIVSNIVVGASNRNALTRKFKNIDVPTSLAKSVPDFCTVYVIGKGKVQSVRSASQPATPSGTPPSSASVTPRQPSTMGLQAKLPTEYSDSEDSKFFSKTSWKSDDSNDSLTDSKVPSSARSMENITNGRHRSSGGSMENIDFAIRMSGNAPRLDSSSDCSGYSGNFSYRSTDMSSENIDFSMTSESSRGSLSSHMSLEMDSEMRRLKSEIQQTMDMYNSACKDAVTAKVRAKELHQGKIEGARTLEQVRCAGEEALAMVEMEKQKRKEAMEAAQTAQRIAELEVQKRKNVEMKAMHEAEENHKMIDSFAHKDLRYRRYSIEDIEVATKYFSASLKIGEGGYGPVYRASLDHTPVAIKVLRPDMAQGQKQFDQEIEVLCSMRHPNMVILVGACPEFGCLVYEYMNYGSLEDRLFRKNNTPPIPWRMRFKIASEIATALLFLHQTKPEPLVHRDLKPGNILLDHNYVSKISDVGLARLVPQNVTDNVTQYHMTAAAGTFCYIDPEYQQTGMLGVKSDIYSLGVMFLQMITAKPPMGLAHQVERAIESGRFVEMLDPAITDWPIEEALTFAKLSLKCCELRKRDRPDLGTVLLPELNRLRDIGMDDYSDHGPYFNSQLPPSGRSNTSEMNARRLLRFKSKAGKWSFNSKTGFLPPRQTQDGKWNKKNLQGGWSCSFVSCSVPNAQLKRMMSFN